jgi:predicted nucleic acid-binding Zn ribbon protein
MSTYRFVCPACEQEIEINASMREAILESGCPVCTAGVGTEHFESA